MDQGKGGFPAEQGKNRHVRRHMEEHVATDFEPGMRVRYVPGHAHGDVRHADCEDGRVSSNNGKYVFVRFNLKRNPPTSGGG